VQTILDNMDWTDAEKNKIWVAACGAQADRGDCNLTFDMFKALIQDKGGYNLPSRVKDSAAKLAKQAPVGSTPTLPDGMFFAEDGTLHRHSSLARSDSLAPMLPGACAAVAEGDNHEADYTASSNLDSQDSALSEERKPALLTKRGTGSPDTSKRLSESLQVRPQTFCFDAHEEPKVPTELPTKSLRSELGSPMLSEAPTPQRLSNGSRVRLPFCTPYKRCCRHASSRVLPC
jgi:hypothetical protein